MLLNRQFFPAFLIGLLLFAGLAQAQNSPGGTNPQSSEMKADGGNYLQPFQPSLNSDQDAIKGPLQEQRRQSPKTVNVTITKPNFQDKTKKVAKVEDTNPKSDLLKPSFGKNRGSITQNMGPQVGRVGSLLTIQGSMHSGGLGASFLDGFLMKSLHDKEIGRKKENTKQESKDDLSRKKRNH